MAGTTAKTHALSTEELSAFAAVMVTEFSLQQNDIIMSFFSSGISTSLCV